MDAADETSRVSKVPSLADPCILQGEKETLIFSREPEWKRVAAPTTDYVQDTHKFSC
jgi:hypothetical protein